MRLKLVEGESGETPEAFMDVLTRRLLDEGIFGREFSTAAEVEGTDKEIRLRLTEYPVISAPRGRPEGVNYRETRLILDEKSIALTPDGQYQAMPLDGLPRERVLEVIGGEGLRVVYAMHPPWVRKIVSSKGVLDLVEVGENTLQEAPVVEPPPQEDLAESLPQEDPVVTEDAPETTIVDTGAGGAERRTEGEGLGVAFLNVLIAGLRDPKPAEVGVQDTEAEIHLDIEQRTRYQNPGITLETKFEYIGLSMADLVGITGRAEGSLVSHLRSKEIRKSAITVQTAADYIESMRSSEDEKTEALGRLVDAVASKGRARLELDKFERTRTEPKVRPPKPKEYLPLDRVAYALGKPAEVARTFLIGVDIPITPEGVERDSLTRILENTPQLASISEQALDRLEDENWKEHVGGANGGKPGNGEEGKDVVFEMGGDGELHREGSEDEGDEDREEGGTTTGVKAPPETTTGRSDFDKRGTGAREVRNCSRFEEAVMDVALRTEVNITNRDLEAVARLYGDHPDAESFIRLIKDGGSYDELKRASMQFRHSRNHDPVSGRIAYSLLSGLCARSLDSQQGYELEAMDSNFFAGLSDYLLFEINTHEYESFGRKSRGHMERVTEVWKEIYEWNQDVGFRVSRAADAYHILFKIGEHFDKKGDIELLREAYRLSSTAMEICPVDSRDYEQVFTAHSKIIDTTKRVGFASVV